VLKNITATIAFVAFIALFLEFSLRLVFFGTDALTPTRMNSHTLIINSDLVQSSEYLDVYYELKPNLDSMFRGIPFKTNSSGLADKEYSLEKPANTIRVAVVGSSWTMPTSVSPTRAYHALLEEQLNAQSSDQHYEFLNFGVEYYGLGELVATVRQKVMPYNPDMILFAVTSQTPFFLWEQHDKPFERQATVPPFRQSYLAATIASMFGKRMYARTSRPKVLPKRGGYQRQMKRAMEELAVILEGSNTQLTVLWMTYLDPETPDKTVGYALAHAKPAGFGTVYANLHLGGADGNDPMNMMTGKLDMHPNEKAHQLIASILHEELWAEN